MGARLDRAVQLLFHQRFHPIFSVLSGVGGGRVALVPAVVLLLLGAPVVLGHGPVPGLPALGYALAMLDVTGLACCCGVLLLLRTPAGPALSAAPAPMGRMALTNYLSATVLFLVAGPLLGIDSPADLPAVIGLTVAIIVVQAVWSVLWLRSFRYGPAEWVWRCLTWWRRAPLRRRPATAPAGA